MAENKWISYGDVNPLEHGGYWVKEDEDCKGSFSIVKISPVDEGRNMMISTGYVCPTDEWIDKEDVYSFVDMDDNGTWEDKAMACFDYYGAANFGGEDIPYPNDEVKEQLKYEGIEL